MLYTVKRVAVLKLPNPVKGCLNYKANGQLSRKAKVVREPKS